MKARIASDGNKHKDYNILKIDSALYSLNGIRILTSIATILKLQLAKNAFLQTCDAKRDVYVISHL